MALRAPPTKLKFTENGAPLAGGKVWTYAANTLTPLATFADAAGAAPNTNPIILNPEGEATAFLLPGRMYDFRIERADGSLLRTDEDISAEAGDTEAVYFADSLAPAYLKTLSDIINGQEVSILRNIDREKHAAILAGTNTDNLAANFNDLLTSMAAAGRGALEVPEGTYHVGSPILIPVAVIMRGHGNKTILKPKAATSAVVRITGDGGEVRDLQILQSGTLASTGIDITAGFFAEVNNVYMANLPIAINNTSGQSVSVEDCTLIGSNFGVFSANDFRNSNIEGCHIQGGTGIWIGKTTTQCEGLRVINNGIYPSITSDPNSGHGIVVNAGLEILITDNIVDNVDKQGLVLAATGGNAIATVKARGNWFGNAGGGASAEGAIVYGNVSDITFDDNTFAAAVLYGLHIGVAGQTAPQRVTVNNNKFQVNAGGDIRVELGTDLRITENQLRHATNPYREESNAITARVYENTMVTPVTARSSGSIYYRNKGHVTEAKGSGTITSAATNSGAINHGLSVTPSPQDFTITLNSIATNDPGEIAVSSITATQFTVFCRNTPGNNLPFGWSVSAGGI